MNVLLIMADQHLATCMGHEGHPQVITPNLDKLAAQSVRFRHAFTQNPICTPSRTSLLSGQYCHNHGYYGLSGPAPDRLPSFLSHFKENGYRTAGIGNLHTPCQPRNWLEHHVDYFADSFERVDGSGGIHNQNPQSPYFDMIRERGLLEKEDFYLTYVKHWEWIVDGRPSAIPFEVSQEGWCVDEAIKFMDGCGKTPFCMQVSLERPHEPFWPDQKFWDMYPDDLDLPPTIDQDPSQRPPHFRQAFDHFHSQQQYSKARDLWHGYLGCITHVDHAVGLLLDYLDRTGLAKNTIVIYTSDHGAYSGTHGLQEKYPGICSDAVCRVPQLWRVPDVTALNQENRQFVELVDIAPTVTSLCGLPPMQTVDGKDISPLLRGGNDPLREVAVTECVWSKSIRWKQWRFVHYQREMFDQDIGELYDIDADPNETRNLYNDPAHQHIVNECRRLAFEWLVRTLRIKTAWPPVNDQHDPPYNYDIVGDGKMSNKHDVAWRVKGLGWPNYI